MAQNETKVIGVFACRSRTEVVCIDRDASVIAGSEEAMRRNFDEVGVKHPEHNHDQKDPSRRDRAESYSRFLPLARDLGIPVAEAAFANDATGERRFITVRLTAG